MKKKRFDKYVAVSYVAFGDKSQASTYLKEKFPNARTRRILGTGCDNTLLICYPLQHDIREQLSNFVIALDLEPSIISSSTSLGEVVYQNQNQDDEQALCWFELEASKPLISMNAYSPTAITGTQKVFELVDIIQLWGSTNSYLLTLAIQDDKSTMFSATEKLSEALAGFGIIKKSML